MGKGYLVNDLECGGSRSAEGYLNTMCQLILTLIVGPLERGIGESDSFSNLMVHRKVLSHYRNLVTTKRSVIKNSVSS